MTFCDALRLHGFGPFETKMDNIIYTYIKIIYYLYKKVQHFLKKGYLKK